MQKVMSAIHSFCFKQSRLKRTKYIFSAAHIIAQAECMNDGRLRVITAQRIKVNTKKTLFHLARFSKRYLRLQLQAAK